MVVLDKHRAHFPDNHQVGFLTNAINLPQDQIVVSDKHRVHFPDNYQVGFLTDAIKLPRDQILRLFMPVSAILMEQYSQKVPSRK
jgi:hypothetical protein